MFIEFFVENILWFTAFFFVLLMLMREQQSINGASYISHLQLPQLQREASVIIDVSKESEFKDGHIAGSTNVPLEKLLEGNNLINKHGNKNIILVCQSGNRSANAAKHLKAQGAKKLFILKGGMLTWKKENLPLEA